jgi:uncharacterized Zn-finger protein
MHKDPELQACTKQHYDVTEAQLPLSCPLPESRVWDAHPRVYLPIEATGHAMCPYCGAQYTLLKTAPDAE